MEHTFKPERIIWHHTADGSPTHQFNKVNEYHRTRGFPLSSMGYYVGYHYLIEADGTVVQARRTDEIGAHDAGENFNSIGICLAGNFDVDYPTEAQANAIAKLVATLTAQFKIPITRIEPHRWDDTTECPGKNMKDNWLIKVFLSHTENDEIIQFMQIGQKYGLI